MTQKTTIETERKFLLKAMPQGEPLRRHHIRQGYIAREGRNVVRIRQMDARYILGIKTPAGGISRHELEVDISAQEAEILFASCANPSVEKVRQVYQADGHVWEVDIFSGDNQGLMVAEVELSHENEAVTLPEWIGPEVTGLGKFYNSSLSQRPFKDWGVSYADLVARLRG